VSSKIVLIKENLKNFNDKVRINFLLIVSKCDSFAVALLLLIGIIFISLQHSKPYYNWDMIPYIATSYTYQGLAPEEVHKETYAVIKASVSPSKFAFLIDANDPYRSGVYGNWRYLQDNLPFWSVKPLYPSLIFALGKLGVNPVVASVVISQVSYALTMLLVFFWCRPWFGNYPSAVFTVLLFSIPEIALLARLSSPDALATFISIFGLYVLAEKRSIYLGLLILAFAMLARPDFVMLVLIMTTLFILVYPANYLRLFIIAIAAFLLYLILGRISGNYGLGTLFTYAYMPAMLEPSKFESTLTLSFLIDIYVHHFKTIPETPLPLYLLCIGMVACHSVKYASKHIAVISIAILFYAVAHWFIMPIEKNRTLAFMLIIGCVLINKLLSGQNEQVAG
jgi:hypothetical protein